MYVNECFYKVQCPEMGGGRKLMEICFKSEPNFRKCARSPFQRFKEKFDL